MPSNYQKYNLVLDKIPDKSGMKLHLHLKVKFSWKYKLRMKVGLWLMTLAARILNIGFETNYDFDNNV
jgi:hypothetical protein